MAICQKDRKASLKGFPQSRMRQVERKMIIKNHNYLTAQESMSSYKYKQIKSII